MTTEDLTESFNFTIGMAVDAITSAAYVTLSACPDAPPELVIEQVIKSITIQRIMIRLSEMLKEIEQDKFDAIVLGPEEGEARSVARMELRIQKWQRPTPSDETQA